MHQVLSCLFRFTRNTNEMDHPIVNKNAYPLLSAIDTPADLRKLPQSSLKDLCEEIRRFLIESLSENPGHFASSMGAVELTVALHYVFDTPYDRIVWDVGHQAYGHKLLTGRRDKFHTNRKLNGLSGFPTPTESPYDTFIAGHASNSISAALGMAVATKFNEDSPSRNVIAVIGDASISGGLAFEGLNNASNTPNNLIIVLNDNNMSIDTNVGSLHRYLGKIHTSRLYNTLRYKSFAWLKKVGILNERRKDFILRFNNSIKSLIGKRQNIFEGLNIRYFGPLDGHDINMLVDAFRDIRDLQGPRIIHLRTIKGKGMPMAEIDPSSWHAPGRFDPVSGERLSTKNPGDSPKYQDVFGETLLELAQANPKIIGITAAMSSGTSVSIMQKVLPNRVFDVGISEGHAVTFAAGLAKDGQIPFVAIYSSFLQRAYDQIIHDVAIQRLKVVFCIDRAGLVGEDGVTHHGAFDLAYMRSVPGMTIAAPRNEHLLRNILYTAQLPNAIEGPIAIRYPRGNGEMSDWHNDMQEIEIGRGEKLRDGNQVVVITIGTIASQVAKAINLAEEKAGISVSHYDAAFLKPLDSQMMQEIAETGLPIVTVEDASIIGGLGSAVLEWLSDNNRYVPVTRLGLPAEQFVQHGTIPQLQQICGIDEESISEAIIKTAKA